MNQYQNVINELNELIQFLLDGPREFCPKNVDDLMDFVRKESGDEDTTISGVMLSILNEVD